MDPCFGAIQYRKRMDWAIAVWMDDGFIHFFLQMDEMLIISVWIDDFWTLDERCVHFLA